jgi:hypothetical protein
MTVQQMGIARVVTMANEERVKVVPCFDGNLNVWIVRAGGSYLHSTVEHPDHACSIAASLAMGFPTMEMDLADMGVS